MLFLMALPCTEADAQQGPTKPYLVLVSMDGFRWDFLNDYPTPAMNELARRGVRAEALLPAFPTLTFPNHYSIATGLYPQNHGIVGNEFPDPTTGQWYRYKDRAAVQDGRWYGGEPIWVAASKAGMKTAAYYFIGSEAEIQGIRPDHWHAYDKSITGEQRTSQVLQWLAQPEETRPQLIMVYFDEVDDHTHWSGVGSDESIAAIARVDGYIQALMDGIESLPHGNQVSLVVVSDHGQLTMDFQDKPYVLDGRFDLSGITPVDNGSFLALHFDQDEPERVARMQEQINAEWKCGHAYRPEDAPEAWQIGDNPRFPELILMAEPGCDALSSLRMIAKIKPGGHGWAPEVPEMHGIFIAAGPDIPAGIRIPAIRNVDVYPLMLRQLGLPISEGSGQKLDSNLELWPQVLGEANADLP
jgi:predicted AlkP superfamily pyrophosphatase or phosphodiesterase